MNSVSSQPALQFGWISSGHIAMEKAAVEVMADSPWKKFLDGNMSWINQHSMAQDTHHKGPDHYINLENSGDFGNPLVGPNDRTVEGVSRHFTADFKQQLQDRFEKQPLSPKTLRALKPAVVQPTDENWEGQSNVLARVNKSYRSLVSQLRHVSQQPPGWVFGRASRIKTLEKTVGELSHYVTDLHQPMHTTGYHSWPIAYVWRSEEDGHDTNSSHEFFEQALMSTEDLWAWRKNFRDHYTAPVAPATRDAMNQRLAREIEGGHLAMPDLIEADRRAWEVSNGAQSYFDTLKASWQPVAAGQMKRGTDNLSMLLQAAYAEAGQPDLAGLAINDKTMSLVCWFTSLPERILEFFKKPLRALGIVTS